jgi:hypothetical protein
MSMNTHNVEQLLRAVADRDNAELALIDRDAFTQRVLASVQAQGSPVDLFGDDPADDPHGDVVRGPVAHGAAQHEDDEVADGEGSHGRSA